LKRFFFILLLLLPAFTALVFWKGEVRGWLLDLSGIRADTSQFKSTCLYDLNERRQRVGAAPLAIDTELQSSLEGFLASVPNASDVDLDFLLQHIQRTYPDVTALSATVVWHPTLGGLTDGIVGWDDALGRQYESLSTVSFRDGYRHGGIAIVAHRLPLFDLELANREGGRYHHTCPRCGAGHAIELDPSARTVQLRCPHCQRPYAILASNSLGKFHRAPSFLTGFSLPEPAPVPDSNTAEAMVRSLWRLVASRCRYQSDGADGPMAHASAVSAGRAKSVGALPSIPLAGQSQIEAWQTPAETWLLKAGDCEDTSLLLADILISEGFDARVALGWNAQGGDHAWCVVRLEDGEQYILETTIEPGGWPLRLLPVSEASAAYRPEQLFDRENLYFSIGGSPAKDYWSENIWVEVKEIDRAGATAQR
jgi:hypothetical protein